MKWKKLILISAFLAFFNVVKSQHSTLKFESKTYVSDNDSLNYRILYPRNFDKTKRYPIVLFLHGMGERGTDNQSQLTHGSKLFLDSIDAYPAIVIFPQCPPTDYWANLYRPDKGGKDRVFEFHLNEPPHPTLALVIELMDEMLQEKFVDSNRFYVSGLSMGAFGVWELLWRIPEKITAAIPICGGGPTEKATAMNSVPIWAIHGIKDDVVHYRMSINMVKSIQKNNGIAKISLYPNAYHNAWELAFSEPYFLSWMFEKSK